MLIVLGFMPGFMLRLAVSAMLMRVANVCYVAGRAMGMKRRNFQLKEKQYGNERSC
jgi:hypothetical protein